MFRSTERFLPLGPSPPHLLSMRKLNTLPRNSVLLISIFGHGAGVDAIAQTCSNLRHYVIMAADLGLPTAGGVVQSAHHVRGPGGGYCRVLGQIRSIDPAADPIPFEVNLPQNWNGKALQFGGGAFNGYLRQSDGRGHTVLGDKGEPIPLAQGYATFGSDSGHHKCYLLLPDIFNLVNADFGVNDEERKNFASDGLKKTHDAAVILMQARYKAAPRRMYFIGGSTGGREAMKVVDRWPADYDGVLAAYAASNQIETDLQFFKVSQAMYAKGKNGQAGWMLPSKTKLLRDAVLQACDARDGLRDDIVSNPASCSFDPATLRCRDGGDHRGCLSDGQERTISAVSEPQITTFSVENGMNHNPGYPLLRGADLVGNLGWVRHPFHPALPFFNSFYYLIGDGLVRSFLATNPPFPASNPKVDLFQINTSNGGAVGHSPMDSRTRFKSSRLRMMRAPPTSRPLRSMAANCFLFMVLQIPRYPPTRLCCSIPASSRRWPSTGSTTSSASTSSPGWDTARACSSQVSTRWGHRPVGQREPPPRQPHRHRPEQARPSSSEAYLCLAQLASLHGWRRKCCSPFHLHY